MWHGHRTTSKRCVLGYRVRQGDGTADAYSNWRGGYLQILVQVGGDGEGEVAILGGVNKIDEVQVSTYVQYRLAYKGLTCIVINVLATQIRLTKWFEEDLRC